MGPTPRRPGDPPDRDYLSDRKSSGLPFPWRKAIMFSGLVATFVGTLLLQLVGDRPFSSKPEPAATGTAHVLAKLSALDTKIDELNLLMTSLSLNGQATSDGLQDIKKRLNIMSDARRAQEERQSSRIAEVVAMLTEFRERGVKRR